MRIICDMDEVIVDMMGTLIVEYNQKYRSDITIEDITQWELPEDMKDIFRRDSFFFLLKPIDGAIDGIRQLVRWGYEVIIATNHSNGALIACDKVDWINECLPELAGNVMLGNRKDLLQGDVIIDDKADYLINSPCPIKICMDRPWNRELTVKELIDVTPHGGAERIAVHISGQIDYRVHSWQQILRLFEGGAFRLW